jgi:hypothetical protein
MPHCPQTLYHNVLWSNWGVDALTRITILGNSLTKYIEAAVAAKQKANEQVQAARAHNTAGYVRAPDASAGRKKKKPSAFAAALAASPVCCDHAYGALPAVTASSASSAADARVSSASVPSPAASTTSAATAASAPVPSSPYPCLSLLAPLQVLREQSVRNTHDSQTVFNDLSLHSFVIEEAMRITLRRIKAEGQTQPQQPQHLRTDEATHSGESALGIDGTSQSQPPVHSPVSSRSRALCAALLQRPSLPSSSAAAPTAADAAGNDGGGGGMADSEIIRSHLTDGPRMG